MMRLSLLLVAAAAFTAWAADDAQLAGMRNLATRMLKSKDAGAESAYCEFAPISQVDGCSGRNRNALRHRIGRKGVIETWVYRSPRESGDPIGNYRGRIDDRQWRALLQTIAGMRDTPPPAGMPGPPLPPGPTETISVLTLSDGKKKAEYGMAGPAPGPIGDAFALPGILARSETDTVWQLSLINPKAEIRKDSIHVTAEWKWRGPAGSRLLFSQAAGGEFCGTARFKWFLDTSDYTVEWHPGSATPGKDRGSSWELPGTKANTLRLAFGYDGPKGKAKRVGLVDGIGIRLVAAGSKDTVSATVFSDRFAF